MALNGSGPISLGGSTTGQSIALELGLSAAGEISLNQATVRNLAGVATGVIIMPTNFWGKSNLAIFGDGSNGALNISSGTLSSGEYTSVTISGSVSCASPTIIYCKGDVTISGTISCRLAQTGSATMQIVRKPGSNTSAPSSSFTAINPDETAISAAGGTLQQVVQGGGAGGAGRTAFTAGDVGSSSGTGCGGGGGGGGGGYTGNGGTLGGTGAAGTSFGGGGGGGGGAIGGNGAGGSGSNGGNGANVGSGSNRGGGGGGAGYPTRGNGGYGPRNYGAAGENFGGGVIWFIVGGNVTITGAGAINCNGGTGGKGGGGAGSDEGGGGGGGSGGGAVRILYAGTYSNSGSITANGGSGAVSPPNGTNYMSGAGGNGGAGSIATFQVVT